MRNAFENEEKQISDLCGHDKKNVTDTKHQRDRIL